MATSSSADDFENWMRLGQVKEYKNHSQGNKMKIVTTLVLSRRRGSMPVGRRSC